MTWETRDGVDEIIVGSFDIRLRPESGKAEIAPGPFYAPLSVEIGDQAEMREAVIRKGYEYVRKWYDSYVTAARENGVELEP